MSSIVSGCCSLAQLWHRFGRIGGWFGIGLDIGTSLCTLFVAMGAPLKLLCNGPTPWQCSQGYLVDSAVIMKSFLWGFFVSVSLSSQVLGYAAPFGVGTTHLMIQKLEIV